MNKRLRSHAGTCRTLTAVLALALSLAAVGPHPACGRHSFGAAEGSSYSNAAVHPGQPLHFEASDIVKRPVCQACLLRLQTAGVHLVAAASCSVPSASGIVPAETAPLPFELSRLDRDARAPPAA